MQNVAVGQATEFDPSSPRLAGPPSTVQVADPLAEAEADRARVGTIARAMSAQIAIVHASSRAGYLARGATALM